MVLCKLGCHSHGPRPVITVNMSLDSWCRQLLGQSTRFVQKVELCTALCAGGDSWGTTFGRNHHHTLLRVFLVPIRGIPGTSDDTLLIERVLSTGGACHSVIPVARPLSTLSTPFHPNVRDRICVTADGPLTQLARDLEVERTVTFGDRASQPRIVTLTQLAQILAFVSRSTKLICNGVDCKFQSRAFAFACLAALGPSLPPRQAGERLECGEEMVDDSVFELGSEAFLGQVPWLIRDHASLQALQMITALKDEPREYARARLFH